MKKAFFLLKNFDISKKSCTFAVEFEELMDFIVLFFELFFCFRGVQNMRYNLLLSFPPPLL